jgi:hypothetical protein
MFDRLGPITRLMQPVPDDTLRQLSAAVLGGYGRVEPEIPDELRQIAGDIVVALSTADLVSFGLRWRPERKGLVGMRRADIPPLSLPNVARNVIAHADAAQNGTMRPRSDQAPRGISHVPVKESHSTRSGSIRNGLHFNVNRQDGDFATGHALR